MPRWMEKFLFWASLVIVFSFAITIFFNSNNITKEEPRTSSGRIILEDRNVLSGQGFYIISVDNVEFLVSNSGGIVKLGNRKDAK